MPFESFTHVINPWSPLSLDREQPARLLVNQGTEQGDSTKENHENDGKVEKQTLHTTPCLKH